jgi:hypothetical protein
MKNLVGGEENTAVVGLFVGGRYSSGGGGKLYGIGVVAGIG